MLDAVQESIRHLSSRSNTGRVLLLISETLDRGSESDLEAVTIAAQTAGITVYAAIYSTFKTAFTSKSARNPPQPRKNPGPPTPQTPTINGGMPTKINPPLPPAEQRVDLLAGIGELTRINQTKTTQALISRTGGVTLAFTRQKGIEDAIEKLGAELNTQYVLSFLPQFSARPSRRVPHSCQAGILVDTRGTMNLPGK